MDIERLEAQGVPLTQALEIVANMRNSFDDIPGMTGEKIRQKMNTVLEKNPGFDTISV
jgi:hypothetical protein